MSTELAQTQSSSPSLLRPIASPQEAIEVHKAVVSYIESTLEQGRDYGNIPNTQKPTLLKPGAERLCAGFGLRAEYETLDSEVDHNFLVKSTQTKWFNIQDPGKREADRLKAEFPGRYRNKNTGTKEKPDWKFQESMTEDVESFGLYRYVIKCRLFTHDGREVGQGVGSCSTLESKYIRAPRDAENTVLKMAMKRAHVSAVLTTLGLSDRFTMDMEDLQENKQSRMANSEDVQDAEFSEDQTSQQTQQAQTSNPSQQRPSSESGSGGTRKPLPTTGPDLRNTRPLIAEAWQPEKDLPGKSHSNWTSEKSNAQYGKLRGEMDKAMSDKELHKHFVCELAAQASIPSDYKESRAFVSFAIDFLTTADREVIDRVIDMAVKRKAWAAKPSDGTNGS